MTKSTVYNKNISAGILFTGTNDITNLTIDSIKELNEKIKKIEERLLIITEDMDLVEKYPALAEAYNHYKLIEKMVTPNE